jgi:hypothetical protein
VVVELGGTEVVELGTVVDSDVGGEVDDGAATEEVGAAVVDDGSTATAGNAPAQTRTNEVATASHGLLRMKNPPQSRRGGRQIATDRSTIDNTPPA